jgi:hypothetical protein
VKIFKIIDRHPNKIIQLFSRHMFPGNPRYCFNGWNNLLEALFNEWRMFERMINRVMYTDSNTTETATSGWIWQ